VAGVTYIMMLAAGKQCLVGEGVARRICRPDLLQGPRCFPIEHLSYLPWAAAGQGSEVSGGERAPARRGE